MGSAGVIRTLCARNEKRDCCIIDTALRLCFLSDTNAPVSDTYPLVKKVFMALLILSQRLLLVILGGGKDLILF